MKWEESRSFMWKSVLADEMQSGDLQCVQAGLNVTLVGASWAQTATKQRCLSASSRCPSTRRESLGRT